jgi:hypothetical protein
MDEQRRLDLAAMTDEELLELERSLERALNAFREVGATADPSLHSVRVDVLVEWALRAQERA